MFRSTRRLTTVVDGTRFHVLGAPRTPLRDVYHLFLRAPWPVALGVLAVAYLGLNALFAGAYTLSGGIANYDGSFEQAFYFSVQTMGTIGYGGMYPQSPAANRLVVLESVAGLFVTALATGLVFAKFGRTPARVNFAQRATIGVMHGVRTLYLRVGNARTTSLLDPQFRVTFTRSERSREGVHFYRSYELTLSRSSLSQLRSAFTLIHPIDPTSPLHGYDAERLAKEEGEISVSVTGLDETTLQPVHATQNYADTDILFGHRPADLLTPQPDGSIEIDLRRFHDVVPVTEVAEATG